MLKIEPIVLAACLGLLLCSCSTVSDADMYNRFEKNKHLFDELAQMAIHDHITCPVPAKGQAPCLQEPRRSEYQHLLRQVAFGVSAYWKQGYLLFPNVSTGGLLGNDVHARGYAYSLGPQLSPQTEDTAAHELEATTLTFRPIKGRWYLYLSP
jgi:hypothetical protein